MAFLLPIIGAVSGAVGIAAGIKGLTQANAKPPAPIAPFQNATAAGTTQEAQANAAAESQKRRKAMAGNTDLTRGSALVPEVNVGKKSLLGA